MSKTKWHVLQWKLSTSSQLSLAYFFLCVACGCKYLNCIRDWFRQTPIESVPCHYLLLLFLFIHTNWRHRELRFSSVVSQLTFNGLPLLSGDSISLVKEPFSALQMRLRGVLCGSSDRITCGVQPLLYADWTIRSSLSPEARPLMSPCSCNSFSLCFKGSIVLLIFQRLKPCSFYLYTHLLSIPSVPYFIECSCVVFFPGH